MAGWVCAVWVGGVVPAWLIAAVVEPIEHRAQHHGDAEREHRDLGAAGRTLGEFGIGLDLVVEALTGLTADFVIGQVGR